MATLDAGELDHYNDRRAITMRAALELHNGGISADNKVAWPDQAKARHLGADRLGFQADDPRLAWKEGGSTGRSFLELLRANGWSLFLSRSLWGFGGSPAVFAQMFVDDMRRLDMLPTQQHSARQCALNADLEVDDPVWILRTLMAIRALLPGRGLTWSFQPHKGGIMSAELVDFINNDRMVTVAPFTYRNDMTPCSERWVVDDLADHGIKRAKVLPYYSTWAEGWDGFLYDLENIA
jgi:hypothetical protein